MRDLIAAALPEYEVGPELGRGGYATVVGGRHRTLDRDVAIKVLPPIRANQDEMHARFRSEARLLATLDHPHVVPIYDYVEHDGLCLLVMEALPGGTVWQRFTNQGMQTSTACVVALAALSGLQHAHARGVLHRDVKPENLLFSRDGVLKVTDFGIAKVLGGGETLATEQGEILGTPAYIAPEQASGAELGPPVDVYAAGVMLYELATGALPFDMEGGALAIAFRHAYEDPIPVRRVAPQVPDVLADVIMRALARDPAERYPSAETFGLALTRAATSAFGSSWIDASPVQVMDPMWIGAAWEASSRTGSAPETVHLTDPAQGSPPSAPPAVPGGEPGSVQALVRPSVAIHARGASPSVMAGGDLVPLGEIIRPPSSPRPLVAVALTALVVMAIVALVGVGSRPPAQLRARSDSFDLDTNVSVGGDRIVPGGEVVGEFDLAEPVPVEIVVAPGAPVPDGVELDFSAAGVPLGGSGREVLADGHADIDVSGSRYLIGPEVTAVLIVSSGSIELARYEFGARGAQNAVLTVPGVVALLSTLATISYAESLLRPLRRGRRGVGSVVILAVVGAGLGVLAVVLVWVGGGAEPAARAAVPCIAFGALAGTAAGVAARRAGGRRRLARLAERRG